jgi:hypothetical protein
MSEGASGAKGRLRPVATDLWVADHAFSIVGLAIGTRTTVIALDDGSLWVHSPGPLTESLEADLREKGPVSCLVAPNLMHHLYLADWIEAFPEARTYAVPGLERVRPGLRIDEALGDEPPPAWKGQIEQLRTAGVPKLDEVDFLHVATRTLILTDLCFNMQSSDSWLTQLGMRLNAAWRRFTPSRLFKSFIEDGDALRSAVEQILEWDFDRVIVAHGDVLESGGPQALRAAYAFIGVGRT